MPNRFDKNPKKEAAIQQVLEIFRLRKRGDVIDYPVLEEVLGQSYRTDWSRSVLFSARRRLRDHNGIETVADYKVGIRLASKQEQLQERPKFRHSKANRQYSIGKKNVAAIPSDELTIQESQLQRIQIDGFERKQKEARATDAWLNAMLKTVDKPEKQIPWG